MTRCSKKRQACPIVHAQDGKRRARKRDANQQKICTEWTQEWTSAKQLRRDKRLDVREVVRGPFCAPKLLRTRPLVAVSSCRPENVNGMVSGERRGIPDTWREYIDTRRFCGATEARAPLQRSLAPCYVRCIATHTLWTELGLPFVQGIPDPWKSESLIQRQSVKCLCPPRTHSKKTSTRDHVNNYDGDDETETVWDVKRHGQSNVENLDSKCDVSRDWKDDSNLQQVERKALQKSEDVKRHGQSNVENVDSKRDVSRDWKDDSNLRQVERKALRKSEDVKKHGQSNVENLDSKWDVSRDRKDDSNLRQVERKALQKDEDAVKKIKKSRKRYADHPPLPENLKLKMKQKKQGEDKVKKSVDNHEKVKERSSTRRKEEQSLLKYDDARPLQKHEADTNVKAAVKSFSNPEKGKETTRSVQTQRSPNIVCCNCTMQNYVNSNVRYLPDHVFQGVDTSERVLCHYCENACRESMPRRADFAPKVIDFCVPEPSKRLKKKTVAREEIYKWTKLNVCACFQKAKQQFVELNGKNRVVSRHTNVFEKDLKLVCCRCDCPYLRISTNTVEGNTHTAASKKAKPENEQGARYKEPTNRSSKRLKTRKQGNDTRCNTENPNCTCMESKRFASKRDHERSPHSTTVKRRNDAGNKNADEIRKEHDRGDDTTARKGILGISGKETGDARNATRANFCNSVTNKETGRLRKSSTRRNQLYVTNCVSNLAKGECREAPMAIYFDRVNRTRRNIRNEDKERKVESNVTSTTSDEKAEIRRSKYPRSDKSSKHSISDGGEYADVSDNFANVSISVTDQDRLSVTSISFINRLNNTIPIRRLYRRRRPRRDHRRPLPKHFQRILGTEDQVSQRPASNEPLKLKRVTNDRNENLPTEACDALSCLDFSINNRGTEGVQDSISRSKNFSARRARRYNRSKHRMY